MMEKFTNAAALLLALLFITCAPPVHATADPTPRITFPRRFNVSVSRSTSWSSYPTGWTYWYDADQGGVSTVPIGSRFNAQRDTCNYAPSKLKRVHTRISSLSGCQWNGEVPGGGMPLASPGNFSYLTYANTSDRCRGYGVAAGVPLIKESAAPGPAPATPSMCHLFVGYDTESSFNVWYYQDASLNLPVGFYVYKENGPTHAFTGSYVYSDWQVGEQAAGKFQPARAPNGCAFDKYLDQDCTYGTFPV